MDIIDRIRVLFGHNDEIKQLLNRLEKHINTDVCDRCGDELNNQCVVCNEILCPECIVTCDVCKVCMCCKHARRQCDSLSGYDYYLCDKCD